MQKRILITLTLIATFGLGFAFNSLITKITNEESSMKKATGIGGYFFQMQGSKKGERMVQGSSWFKY
jgi:hypothetical protein